VTAEVLDVRFRARFSEWLESILPWYDQDRERAKFEQFKAQVDTSRKVRFSAEMEVSRSRRDRRGNLRESFRAAGHQLGKR